MVQHILTVASLLLFLPSTGQSVNFVVLVQTDAAWKYLDNGTDQGTAWRASAFVDSGWASGPAPLGYGDPHIVTTNSFGPDSNNKYITTYYRRSFTVTNPSEFGSLRVRLLRDDGAVVYLNGTEILRDNMPTGAIAYTTLAPVAVGGSDETKYFEFNISPAFLVSGTNVLAVEIHQNAGTSSDLGFALELAGTDALVLEGANWRYWKGTTQPSPGITWTTNGFNDASWLDGPSGFGYGDSDDATTLSDMQNSYVSVFTRKLFQVANPASVTNLTLAVDYDDGFVAYLNGTEVARRNMPAGTPINTTTASTDHEASRGTGSSIPQEKEFIAINPALLLTGTNVLAVSGHNVSLSSSDLSLIVELYQNVTLVRGPFIQMPNDDKVTVVWRTDSLTDSAVDYGLTASYELGTVTDPATVREHVIHIPGLMQGTNYFYRVRSGGATLREGDFFRTKRPTGQAFKFSIIGDFGAGTAGMFNIANQVNAVDSDMLITVGDNIYNDGQPGLYDPYWFSIYAPTMRRVPTFPCLGNHDIISAGGQWMVDYFYSPTNGPSGYIEKNYSYDYGNAHFVVVDSNPFNLNQAAAVNAIKTWVSNDLAATVKPWKFVFTHHPPYTSTGNGSHDDDAGVKANLMPVLENAGVDVLFVGHNHFYERINAINGVHHIITGSGGQSLSNPNVIKEYSAVRVVSIHSFTRVELDGLTFKLEQRDANGAVVDTFNLTKQFFRIDGLLENAAWLRAQNPSGLRLYAAIRGPYLYVATQDAGEGSDHFIYLNNQTDALRSANWSKAGQVMNWNAFLADENDNGFKGWFDSTETQRNEFPAFQSMTSGLNNNGATGNGVLEGAIDLTSRFGSMPPQIYLAAAPFATTNGGALVAAAQVPTGNGNGNVESTEFLLLNTRDIALDLPVAVATASPATVEAGLPVALVGSASTAPSGLPLSYNWSQLSGLAVTLVNSNSATATFTSSVDTNTVLTFQLTVNDTRFSSNATTTVTMTQIVDTDGDGLSDQEELTGTDNVLTAPNPSGQTTDPNRFDTDGDGQSDGVEALAGTNPNSPASVFSIVGDALDGAGFRVDWSCVVGKKYRVQYRDDMFSAWSDIPGDVMATTATTNIVDATAVGQPHRYYRVFLVP